MSENAKPSVGVDIDGCLAHSLPAFVKYCNQVSGQDHKPEAVALPELEKVYGWDEDEYLQFYRRYGERIHAEAVPAEGAAEALESMRENYRIHVVTARLQRWEQVTREWLQRHGMTHDRLHFTDLKTKEDVCAAHDIGVLVEDSPRHLKPVHEEGTAVVIFDNPYNRHVDLRNSRRVEKWSQVPQAVRELIG